MPSPAFSISAALAFAALRLLRYRINQTMKNGAAANNTALTVMPAMAPGGSCGPGDLTKTYLRVKTVSVIRFTCEPDTVVAGRNVFVALEAQGVSAPMAV